MALGPADADGVTDTPQPLAGLVVLALCVLWGRSKGDSIGPVKVNESVGTWIMIALLVLLVIFAVLPLWDVYYHGMCPAGQHPVGGNAGTDVECVLDR